MVRLSLCKSWGDYNTAVGGWLIQLLEVALRFQHYGLFIGWHLKGFIVPEKG